MGRGLSTKAHWKIRLGSEPCTAVEPHGQRNRSGPSSQRLLSPWTQTSLWEAWLDSEWALRLASGLTPETTLGCREVMAACRVTGWPTMWGGPVLRAILRVGKMAVRESWLCFCGNPAKWFSESYDFRVGFLLSSW